MRKMLFKVETEVCDQGKVRVVLSRKNGDILHSRTLFGKSRSEAFVEVVSDYLLSHGLEDDYYVRRDARINRPVWVWKEV